MVSQYYENHISELMPLFEKYNKSKKPHIQYRSRCIAELIKWEEVKDE